MRKIGTSVFWSIADSVMLTPEILTAAGFAKEIPRNDPKTALIKACKVVKKDWAISDADIGASSSTPSHLKRGDHKRYHDTTIECRIALTRPKVEDGNYSTETAMTVKLLKGTSQLEFDNVALEYNDFSYLCQKIEAEYERAKGTIDSTQFRLLVSRYVANKCAASSLKAFSGGIYFVAERYADKLDQVRGLFSSLDKRQAVFEAFPIYDDGSGVADSVSHHVTVAFERELERFLRDLQEEVKAGISKKTLESRMKTVEEIKDKIRGHEDHLRQKADDMRASTDRWLGLLEVRMHEAKGKTVEPFDLMAELADIDLAIAARRRA